jgi:adenosylmethionine---8-amino-7-oxononanoate aminotransferase
VNPEAPTPAQLARWDLDHVWHPFTPQDAWEADGPPLIIERAEGVHLVDVQGRRYLDGVASLWTNVHGHGHPKMVAAMTAQLGRVAHSTLLGLAGTPSILLAKRLVDLVARIPGERAPLTRVFYSDAGSTAVEVALKVAFQHQQQRGDTARTGFAALAQAYHGDTIGSVSVGGVDLFHAIYRPLLFDAVRIPCPDRPDPATEAACLQEARALFAVHGPTLAALIVEPLVQGAAGMRMHSPGFLQSLSTLCKDAGVLLIVDEVATGFGRTGTLFALEQAGVRPDILCLAKGLTGGLVPLAATLVTEHIFDSFRGPPEAHRTFFHGHTYTGNALACAAALASLDIFEDEDVLASLPERSAALAAAIAQHMPAEHIDEVRQRGLMCGLVLRHDQGPAARVGHQVCMAARSHGAIIRPLGDTLVLMPPLAMSPEELDRLVRAVAAAVRAVLDQG